MNKSSHGRIGRCFLARIGTCALFAFCLAGSAIAGTWTWLGTVNNLSWTSPAYWQAPEGATGFYPDSIDDDVIIPYFGNDMIIKLDSAEIYVRSITCSNNPANLSSRNTRTAPVFGAGNGVLHIGAGGVQGVGSGWGRPVPGFNCDVVLEASQDWRFEPHLADSKNNDTTVNLYFSRKLSCAADVVWRVANPGNGLYFAQSASTFDASEFYGTLRTGASIHYKRWASSADKRVFGNAAAIISLNDPAWGFGDGYGGSLTSSRTGLISDYVATADAAGESIPFNFSFDWSSTAASNATPYLVFEHISNNSAADYHTLGYTQSVATALIGPFANKVRFCGSTSATRYSGLGNNAAPYFPDRQWVFFSGDNSGMAPADGSAYIDLYGMIAIAGSDNAFGAGNAIPLKTSFINTYAAMTGVLAKDGVTINSPISRFEGNDYYMIFGAADEDSTCVFKGNLAASGVNPIRLTAPRGAKARFEGVLSGNLNTTERCLEIFGGGDIEFAAANTFNGTPNVRSGRLLLANNMAVNNKKVLLGGVVPREDVHVRLWHKANAFTGMTAALSTYFDKGQGYYTANTAGDYTLQGVTLEAGDLVLQNGNPEFGNKEGIYETKILDDGKVMLTNRLELATLYGLRIDVDEGTWAGEYLYFCRDGNVARQHILEEKRNPDVALMISADGVTNAGAIDVVNNYSAGASMIGMTAAGAGTFSGAVALARDVTFYATNGATVTVSGSITGSGDIVKDGPGTAALTGVISAEGGLVLKGGTLQMASADVSTRTNVAWTVSAETGTGILAADGHSFTGTTVSFTFDGTPDRDNVYVIATDTTGVPTSAGLTGGWKLAERGDTLILHCPPSATVLIVR